MSFLSKIKLNRGREVQLKPGVAQNQQVRASDFNPIVDYLNAGKNDSVVVPTASTTPTINSRVGQFTTGNLTIAGVAANSTIVVTNSTVTATSLINVQVVGFSGTFVTDGIPIVVKVVPATGSFTVTVVNVHATAAMTAKTLTLQFQIV